MFILSFLRHDALQIFEVFVLDVLDVHNFRFSATTVFGLKLHFIITIFDVVNSPAFFLQIFLQINDVSPHFLNTDLLFFNDSGIRFTNIDLFL